jgi:complex iron-sulfur molybdoenzyme family reductase subunit gamma
MNGFGKLSWFVLAALLAFGGGAWGAPTAIRAARVATGADAGDPASAAWDKVRATEIALVTAPAVHASIAGTAAAAGVSVQALSDGRKLYVRLSWSDPTADTARHDAGRFLDGVALQFPLNKSDKTVVLMGNPAGRVNIWYWRADGQVQNLFADGFGTLTPAPVQDVTGKGIHANGRWTVVLSRDLKSAAADGVQLKGIRRIPVAPAVWNGANAERDGFKATTMEWQSLVLSAK